MSYAINAQGTGWRAVESEADLLEGETFSETQPELQPDPKDIIRNDIAGLLASAKLLPGQEWLLDVAMASMVSAGATQGLSEPELYAVNPGYKQAKDLAAQVAAKKALL